MRSRRAKVLNLVRAVARNTVSFSAPFVRFIPTDRCNLDCRYCFQKSDDPREMSIGEFEPLVDKARELGLGMASFLGGEPLTWKPLEEAISLLTERNVLSDVTTNGSLLTSDRIRRLGRAGLDLLNVSADVVAPTAVTAKASIFRSRLLADLVAARREYGLRVRINSVCYRGNEESVRELVELAHRHEFPISVGFVVPHLDREGNDGHCFAPGDEDRLRSIVRYLVGRKRQGYAIVDTRQYYLNVFRFLRRERFWECNYGRRIGWLNVTPSGRIRSCTKKMDELPIRFLDLTPATIRDLRRRFRRDIRACNVDCYSNCAYDGAYFYRNMPAAILRHLARAPSWSAGSLRPAG